MSDGLIVLCCGGRDYNDARRIGEVLTALNHKHGITLLIHGDCSGADRLAERWAHYEGVNYAKVPALWHRHGKAAGPMRNAVMLRMRPDVVVAFPGGRGTANMKQLADDAGVRVWEPMVPAEGVEPPT